MTGISRRRFGVGAGALAVSTFAIGKVSATFQSQTGGYPIASDVFTTLQRTVVPCPPPSVKIELYEIAKYQQYGFGNWAFGGPLKSVTRSDIMPALYDGSAVTKKEKLLKFFTMTDVHITDKESPNQAVYLQRLHKALPVSAALYSGMMLYTTHVLDAAVQTINALHKKDPFDFGISLGDVCNSTQYNEQRWYIDVLDAKFRCSPRSGYRRISETLQGSRS